MIKRLLVVASCILGASSINNAAAQGMPDLFNMPDTVCTDHEIEPYDILVGATTYNWNFCPPDLRSIPVGRNEGVNLQMNTVQALKVINAGAYHVAFYVNKDGSFYRTRYENGVMSNSSMTQEVHHLHKNTRAFHMVNDGNVWHAFIIAGEIYTNATITRYTFGNGILQAPTEIKDLGHLNNVINGCSQLVIARDNDNWHGFTVNPNNELVRINFGNDLHNVPAAENLGSFNSNFNNVTSLNLIHDQNNWYLFVTNKIEHAVKQFNFGTSLSNYTPVMSNFGDLEERLKRPTSLSITKDCDTYYGWALSEQTNSLVALVWENGMGRAPKSITLGNMAGIRLPGPMSNTFQDNGSLFLFGTNLFNNSVSKIEFKPCTQSNIPSKDQRLPPTFKFAEPGVYNITLTVDEGLPTVRTECQSIVVYDRPIIELTAPDTMICQGDEIEVNLNVYGTDSITWYPNYNIDTTIGRKIKIKPQQATDYQYTVYFNRNCVVRDTLKVNVSKIFADAGPDRKTTDGSSLILGGPNTSVGDGYHYYWYPEIGVEGSQWDPVTTVRPPYNITYYLNVKNDYGCEATDSVTVVVPCDNIHLPNAFSPSSDNHKVKTFGLLNQQFAKLNAFNIFDRWGKLVFSTTELDAQWDGMVEGKPAPVGVYVWHVDANCANTFERFNQSGSVTLIR